jgi:hypothetical protein
LRDTFIAEELFIAVSINMFLLIRFCSYFIKLPTETECYFDSRYKTSRSVALGQCIISSGGGIDFFSFNRKLRKKSR